ncbi:transmembrane protein 100-like [Syngnathus typhle]|uniref:transmembrane protein 100-like n=1 Tax=Syngnathus typhle TaxID=161592 RepID=UPI002A6AAE71|nr:transmembrane protein 100-like [Syngnathus typhle]
MKMSQLFLAEDGNPATFSYEKLSSGAATRVDEAQLLSAATGGAEVSCHRCAAPFGAVALIAGAAVTAVAYAFNSHGSIISVLGLALLGAGLGSLGAGVACRRLGMRGKGDRGRRESQADLVIGQ